MDKCLEKIKDWWNRDLPQPWLTLAWLAALAVITLYGYAICHAL